MDSTLTLPHFSLCCQPSSWWRNTFVPSSHVSLEIILFIVYFSQRGVVENWIWDILGLPIHSHSSDVETSPHRCVHRHTHATSAVEFIQRVNVGLMNWKLVPLASSHGDFWSTIKCPASYASQQCIWKKHYPVLCKPKSVVTKHGSLPFENLLLWGLWSCRTD